MIRDTQLATSARLQHLDAKSVATALQTSSREIAESAGLSNAAATSQHDQRALRQMLAILLRMEPRLGSAPLAYAWYRSQPLPGFDAQTAMCLLRDGHAVAVLTLIDAVDAGVHS
ncbi:MAG: hypothetical protein AAFY02_21625 [Pseudomonadota bacterium]